MRVSGPNGPAAPASAPTARRSASGSFSLPQSESSPAPAGTADGARWGHRCADGTAGHREPQGTPPARGQTRHRALDLLDQMKLAILSGGFDPSILLKLKTAAA